MVNQSAQKIKKILLIVVSGIALIGFVLVFKIVKPLLFKDKAKEQDMVVTEPAPVPRLLNNGFSIDNGKLVISIDGKDYVVMEDGTVWVYDDQGNLQRVTDAKTIHDVLIKAFDSEDDLVNKNLIEEHIDLASLTDSQIKELAQKLGISESQLRDKVNQARRGEGDDRTMADAHQTLDMTTLSDDELRELAKKLGVSYEELKEAVEKAKKDGKSLSAKDFLENSILNDKRNAIDTQLRNIGRTDITADEVLKALDEQGIDFDTFLKDFIGHPDDALEKIGFARPFEYVEGENNTNQGGLLNSDAYQTAFQNANKQTSNNNSDDISYLRNLATSQVAQTPYESVNGQNQKKGFMREFQNGSSMSQIKKTQMKNMLIAGTPIKAVLVTGINTDLPGQITAQVIQDVYDHFSVTNVLVPADSILVATYDSAVTWGQERILIAWQQIIRPDGLIIDLNGYQSVDSEGFAGQGGEVNNHIGSMIGATAMASLVTAATGQFTNYDTNSILLSALLQGTGSGINTVANNLLNNAINRQPTILVKAGTVVTVLVNDNIEIPTYKGGYK